MKIKNTSREAYINKNMYFLHHDDARQILRMCVLQQILFIYEFFNAYIFHKNAEI